MMIYSGMSMQQLQDYAYCVSPQGEYDDGFSDCESLISHYEFGVKRNLIEREWRQCIWKSNKVLLDQSDVQNYTHATLVDRNADWIKIVDLSWELAFYIVSSMLLNKNSFTTKTN